MAANPLVGNLIDVARHLAAMPGKAGQRQAALRRAVSTAYYALFHQLCFLVADELVGWSKTEQLAPIYRLIDHGPVERVLSSDAAGRLGEDVAKIGSTFRDLQALRRDADHSQPGRLGYEAKLFSKTETLSFITQAERAIDVVAALPNETRLRLATLLVTQGLRR